MTQPAPPEDVEVLTDEERAADWAAVRKRIERPVEIRPRRRRRAYAYAAAAALVVLVAGAILYRQWRPKEPTGPGKPPQVAKLVVRSELHRDETIRGNQTSVANVLKPGDEYVLTPIAADVALYGDYRFDVVDLDTNEVVWSRAGFHASPGGLFELTLSNQVLKPGGYYRVVLHGLSGGKLDRLATYSVRVSTK